MSTSPLSSAPENEPATLTYAEAATYLGIGVRTLRDLTNAGTVRHVRPAGRLVRFRRVDLDAYLDRTARGGDPKGRKTR